MSIEEERHDLIVEHMNIARKLASTWVKRVPPHIPKEEILSCAYLGLVKAAKTWERGRGSKFSVWAWTRIEGEIKDFLRAYDDLTRSQRKESKEEHLTDVYSDEYFDKLQAQSEDIDELIFTNEIIEQVTAYLENDNREHTIFKMYVDGVGQEEIAETMGITQSRVSQIVTKVRSELRHLLPS